MFTFDQIFTPLWDTDTVYGESFTMYRDRDGEVSAPFLFEPLEILEVRTADLETKLEEGKDWVVRDGRLFITPGSSAPVTEYDEIFMKNEVPGHCFVYPDGYLLFGAELNCMHNRQIAVTYKCKPGQWQGYVPSFEGERLKRTISRLKNDKKLKIVHFGDSISQGANGSAEAAANPFQPNWTRLYSEKLRRSCSANVQFINTSVGGKETGWALTELDNRVIAHEPDLAVIAFGMNDGGYTPEVFSERVEQMIVRTRSAKPDTDFILVATSTPNPLLTDDRAKFCGNQPYFKDKLYELAEKYDGVAVANITDVQKELMRSKRYIDFTGNNVNHPNDFFIRVHAHVMAEMLIEK